MKRFRTNDTFVLTRGINDKRIFSGCSIERVGVIADRLRPGTKYGIWQLMKNNWVCVRSGSAD